MRFGEREGGSVCLLWGSTEFTLRIASCFWTYLILE